MHRLSMNCFDGDQFIDIGFCCVFPITWFVASMFSWMLAFAVFSNLHSLLLLLCFPLCMAYC